MNEKTDKIRLLLEECYYPTITIYRKQIHIDKNGKNYYKALYTCKAGKKYGFIVRENFLELFDFKLIFEVELLLTDNGATLINYETLETFRKKKNIDFFIELRGLYILGEYIIILPDSEKEFKIFFLPFPNNISFKESSVRVFESQKNFLKHFHLKIFSKNSLKIAINHVLFNSEEEFLTDPQVYIVLHRSFRIYEEDSNEYGSWITGEYYKHKSIVFDSETNLNENLNLTDEEFACIQLELSAAIDKIYCEIEFMKELKKLIKKQCRLPFKIEFELPESIDITDEEIKQKLNLINGSPYCNNDLCLGLERDILYKELSDYDNSIDIKNSEVSFALIIQV